MIKATRLAQSVDILCLLLAVQTNEQETFLQKENAYSQSKYAELLVIALTTLLTTRTNPSNSLTLIFEDLQYADPSSLNVLSKVLHNCRDLPIFCLAVQRTTVQPAWQSSSSREIKPLAQEDVAKLVHHRFGCELSAESTGQIANWTQGNPLFVLELLQWLLQNQWLTQVGNRWQLKSTLETPQIPRNIHGILQDRINGLPPDLRQILEELAPLGTKFPETLGYRLLQQSPGQHQRDLDILLYRLEEDDFIRQNQTSIAFRHDLTHEAVLQRLSNSQRRQSHRRIAHLWLEIEGTTERAVRERANHLYFAVCEFTQGYEPMLSPEDATPVDLLNIMQAQRQAGEQAQRQYNYDAALTYFQRAYEICLAASAERWQTADFARRIGRLNMLRSQHSLALDWMQRGLNLLGIIDTQAPQLTSAQERQIAAMLLIHTASIYYTQNSYPQALIACTQGLQMVTPAEDTQDRKCVAEGSNVIGAVLDAQGKSREALQYYQQSQTLWEDLGDLFELNRARGNMSSAYFALGQWDDALTLDSQAFAFWDKIGDIRRKGLAALNIGLVQLFRGEWADAEKHFVIGRLACETSEDYRHVALAYTNLGLLKLATGQLDWAETLFTQSQEILKPYPTQESAEPLYGLSEVALRKGDVAKAQQFATNALHISQDSEADSEECISLRCLGLAHLASNQSGMAESALLASLQIAETRELKFEIGRTCLALGVFYVRMNRKVEASRNLERASAIFTALRATPWLQQAIMAQGDGETVSQ